MSKKSKVIEMPVETIDLVAEPPMKQKRAKKIAPVLEAVIEPVVEALMDIKPKTKGRKVKTPVPEELELNRNYETVDYAQPAKATKKSNCWIDHIKKFALENGITYNKAMIHDKLKESYVKSSGSKGKVNLN